MNIFSGLLFQHGHITNVALARSLADADAAPAPPTQDARQAKRARRLALKRMLLVRQFTALSPFR
jgi:hypothetical protein